jgi:hypothetical protein
MDASGRSAAWSGAWGVAAAVASSGGAFAWVTQVGSRALAWPVLALAVMTFFALYMSFAHVAGVWPARRGRRSASVDIDLNPESVGAHLRLEVVNRGKPVQVQVQVIGMADPLGRRNPPQSWTIPWHENSSVEPRIILSGGRQVLDFAWFDADAVDAEIRNGQGDASHWQFSAIPARIGARYHNPRSRADIEMQRFILIVRILLNPAPEQHIELQLSVGVLNGGLVCEVAPQLPR